jgi:putative hydrolase of the HAD superfamily
VTAINAVIFDFGGVICFHPTSAQIEKAAEMAGVSVEDFDRAMWTNRLDYDAGHLSADDYWSEVAALAGSQVAGGVLAHLDVDFWSRFDARVLNWVSLLRERGFATAILSNLPRPLGEALRTRRGFLEHFDHLTFSYELGLVKPQREIYEHALAGLGMLASQALFLDDRPRNIQGAVDAGLEAQLYSSWEEFLAGDPAARYGLPAPASVGSEATGPAPTGLDADACRQ